MTLTSLTVLKVEVISTQKYTNYNVKWNDKDFFTTLVMITILKLFLGIPIHDKVTKRRICKHEITNLFAMDAPPRKYTD